MIKKYRYKVKLCHEKKKYIEGGEKMESQSTVVLEKCPRKVV